MVPFLALTGCAEQVRKANVDLRKQVQTLDDRIATLERQHAADTASIKTIEQQRGTLSTLPYDQIEKLYTVHGIKFNRLTRADSKGIAVYVVPTDEEGQDLKAAGSFIIEAWDAGKEAGPPLVRREFTVDQARAAWRGRFLVYDYVLECPWETPPTGSSIKIKVTFLDLLTQREFTGEKVIERETGN